MTGSWEVEANWVSRSPSHINLLESQAYHTLLRRLCLEGEPLRFTALLDSRVAKCAHAKGSSSSVALTPTPVSGGLYVSFGFAPTRLNVADDPTRDKEIRESSGRRCLSRYHQPPCNTSILFICPARWLVRRNLRRGGMYSSLFRFLFLLLPCCLDFPSPALFSSPRSCPLRTLGLLP